MHFQKSKYARKAHFLVKDIYIMRKKNQPYIFCIVSLNVQKITMNWQI